MKLAIIQDQLLTPAGTERVFLYMVEEFREADIFTLAYNKNTTWDEYKNYKINTSILNPIIRSHKIFKYLFPISTIVMKNWDFSEYDLILTSSATTAKYIKRYNGNHICFCYTPTRAIWDSDAYFSSNGLIATIKKKLLHTLRKRDISSVRNIDRILTQSLYSQKDIKKIYKKNSEIIFPPIEYDKFNKAFSAEISDNYLIVSRLEKWKKLEFAIKAFNILGYELRIIGSGPEKSYLKSIAKPNIKFLGSVNDNTLVKEYGRARAIIFTPELEYGLIPIEANAAGRVVISYGKGAIWETMIPYDKKSNNKDFTAVFFEKQEPENLINAVKIERKLKVNRTFIAEHAKNFSINQFKAKLRTIIEEEATKI